MLFRYFVMYFVEVLSAPVPYMVGVHSSFLYKTSLQQVNGPKGIEYVEVEEKNKAYCIGSETIQIFLDENRIDVGSSGTYPPPLPDHAGRKLLRVIEQHAPSYAQRGSRWHDQQLPLYDSAFKTAAPPSAVDDWDTPETLGILCAALPTILFLCPYRLHKMNYNAVRDGISTRQAEIRKEQS